MRRRRRGGFTLVELLVVIAIMAVLSTIGVAIGREARLRAMRDATRALVDQTNLAVREYRSITREAPPSLEHLLTRRTRIVIAGDPRDPRSARVETFGPLLPLHEDQMSLDRKEILDAWGDPLLYDPSRSQGPAWSRNVNDR